MENARTSIRATGAPILTTKIGPGLTGVGVWAVLGALACGLFGCDDVVETKGPKGPVRVVAAVTEPQLAGEMAVGVRLTALDADAVPVAGVALQLAVTRGGGSLAAAQVVTGPQGEVQVDGWRLGVAPVLNRLHVTADEVSLDVDIAGLENESLSVSLFGDLNGFLEANGIEGSTEDLAFTPQGDKLLVGMTGGLGTLDANGTIDVLQLQGEAIERPLGVAFTSDGDLWVCDFGAAAVLRVSPDGEVATMVTHDGTDDLVQPNYVAVGRDGSIFVTDPCLGRLYRIDPVSGEVTARLQFDLNVEGGPNGIAIDAEGALYVITENTVLLCLDDGPDVELTDPIAGIYRTTFDGNDFSPKEAVATRMGLFGDGATFDNEGNLYAIFNTANGFALDESIVFVVPQGQTTPKRLVAFKERVVANLAFGSEAFGKTTLYMTLLAFQPFVAADARGIVRLDLGIEGLPLTQ